MAPASTHLLPPSHNDETRHLLPSLTTSYKKPIDYLSSISSSSTSSSSSSSSSSTTEYLPLPSSTSLIRSASPPGLGYLLMFCSAVCQALMTFFVHVSESTYNFGSLQALFVRSSSSLFLAFAVLWSSKLGHVLRLPTRSAYVTVLSQGFVGGVSIFFSFVALARLPVAIAVTIMYTSPIITSILAAFFLAEPFTSTTLLTLVLNFVGIAFVSQQSPSPGSVTGTGGIGTTTPIDPTATVVPGAMTTMTERSAFDIITGIAFALLSATSVSFVFILGRNLAGMRVHFLVSVIATAACMFVIAISGAILTSFTSSNATAFFDGLWKNGSGLLFAVLSAFAGFFSQSFLHLGIQNMLSGPATIMRSLSVPISFVLGALFLAERPSVTNSIGIALVLGSVVVVGVRQVAEEKRKRTRC